MTAPNRTENYRFIEIHCHRTEAESVAHACEDLPALLAVVTAERDQARQMLADAPHGDDCATMSGDVYDCDCWKAGL